MMSLLGATALTSLLSTAASFSLPDRPRIDVSPKSLVPGLPESPSRDSSRICIVDPLAEDAGPELIKQANECNNGGTVVFLPDETYRIDSPTDLTFLEHVDIAILGTVTFSEDIEYWQTAAFTIAFQDTTLFWKFGGEDVNIYGLGVGTIDGEHTIPCPVAFLESTYVSQESHFVIEAYEFNRIWSRMVGRLQGQRERLQARPVRH